MSHQILFRGSVSYFIFISLQEEGGGAEKYNFAIPI
jgi:hypothetical protein